MNLRLRRVSLHLRNATLGDLEDLTQIAIAVIPQEPSVLYQYPKTDKYPEDVYKYTRLEMKQLIEDKVDNWKYKVMLCETESMDNKSTMETIAFSVWEVSALKDESLVFKSDDGSERRDADPARIKFYQEIINNARRKYLEPSGRKNGPLSYLHLTRLATYPKWQRHGAGTLLSQWGIDVADKQNLNIGLFASPSGEALYKELGFKELQIVVQMPGEEESVAVACMKRVPRSSG